MLCYSNGTDNNVIARIFVSDVSVTTRACADKSVFDWIGCEPGVTGDVCVCDTELCNGNGNGNGAVMTSSLGHVIVVVALVITGYLM